MRNTAYAATAACATVALSSRVGDGGAAASAAFTSSAPPHRLPFHPTAQSSLSSPLSTPAAPVAADWVSVSPRRSAAAVRPLSSHLPPAPPHVYPLWMSATVPETAGAVSFPPMPEQGDDGLYHIMNEEQHRNFLDANQDKLVIIKFYAPWCRACKGLEPRFLQISKDKKYKGLPMVWADLTIQHNKKYVKSLGILALPSVQFYAGSDGIVENFPCGPSKVPILKTKLEKLVTERIDPETKEVRAVQVAAPEAKPCTERSVAAEAGDKTKLSVGNVVLSEEQLSYLRKDIPYFKDFTDEEFDGVMAKAKLQTFEAGDVIMRQGMEGNMFYVIESGEVEISVKAAFEDPLTTPSTYLGTVINRLSKNNYFGERALITGEPRAASIRASSKTRCFAFDKEDIPESSVLSGKGQATVERMGQINDKYGLDVYDIDFIESQFVQANAANQARGSVNQPKPIVGVDVDEGALESVAEEGGGVAADETFGVGADDVIIPLLVRFKLIRHAARCFEYIMSTQPNWGDPGEMRRRSMLVSRLTPSQRDEFKEVFKIIDKSDDGFISMLELKRAMESVGEEKSDEELREMINKGNPAVDGNDEIGFHEFMGVMAEAEFYYLFQDTFSALDAQNVGFVRARDLDRVLCGVRDLISDDRMSIIDVEDKDMLIDYEQFSNMLLGKPL